MCYFSDTLHSWIYIPLPSREYPALFFQFILQYSFILVVVIIVSYKQQQQLIPQAHLTTLLLSTTPTLDGLWGHPEPAG